MKKIFQIIQVRQICLLLFVFGGTHSYAQQWTGASDSEGILYRNGNVGIGGSAASNYKLVVHGEIHVNRNYPYIQFNSSYWNGGSFIQNGVTNSGAANGEYFLFYNTTGKGFNFHQAGYDVLTLAPNRSVGINTNNPQGKLDINHAGGQLRLSGGTLAGGVWTNATDLLYLGEWTSGRGLQINMTTGNVGVGTSNPDQRLTVNGKVKAEEVLVVVDVPADYVFDSAYKRMPLEELEHYIAENNHLPNIPSAAELKADGWKVGEMSNKLLEKVEELTLYMIENKKEIERQKNQIEEQVRLIREQKALIDQILKHSGK